MRTLFNALAVILIVAFTGSGCTPGTGKASLNTYNDTLAYTIGVLTGESMKQDQLAELDPLVIARGIEDALQENTEIDPLAAREYLNMHMQKRQEKVQSDRFADVKAQGQKYLEENRQKDGVQVTESGLQYKIIEMGDGAKPKAEDKVRVHYEGTHIDGTVFDSSYETGEPLVFAANRVIPGWTEALQLMPVGSSFMVYIPYNLAYGVQGRMPQIKPYETLVFKIELLDIVEE
jgi:FKBP-type peptidyl-prolyl cis-trans isomerase